MAKKITSAVVQEMLELYKTEKTYTAVAKKMGISASTVSKYLKEAAALTTKKHFDESIAAKPIEMIDPLKIREFFTLSLEETNNLDAFVKEYFSE